MENYKMVIEAIKANISDRRANYFSTLLGLIAGDIVYGLTNAPAGAIAVGGLVAVVTRISFNKNIDRTINGLLLPSKKD